MPNIVDEFIEMLEVNKDSIPDEVFAAYYGFALESQEDTDKREVLLGIIRDIFGDNACACDQMDASLMQDADITDIHDRYDEFMNAKESQE